MEEYKFKEDRDTMVITTEDIVNHGKQILVVTHDEEDGMWEFLDGYDVEEDNAILVSLSEIIEVDHSINDLWDLPLGGVAYRENKNEKWIRL